MQNFHRSIAAAAGALMLAAAWIPASVCVADQPSYYEPPKFKLQIKPNYPESARARHEVGTVSVKVLVGLNGKPKAIMLAKSSGHADLDAEVLRVAKLSTYYPATRDNKPTLAFYDFSYNFTLAGLSEIVAAASENSRKLAADPKNVPARLALIEADISKDSYAHAEGLGDEGIKVVPNDGRAWAGRASAYYADGSKNNDTAKLKIAADSYDQAVKLDPKAAPSSVVAAAYAEYGFHLWQEQQYGECLPYATKAIQKSPKSWQYLMLKADCETGLQQYKAAIADYQSAQQLDDKKSAELTSRLVASLGNAQLASGAETDGLQTMFQAERISPKAVFAYQYLASYYITKNPPNLNAALSPLQMLAQLQPTNVQAQINIGDIYVRQKNYTAAQAAYTKAIGINPNSGDAQFGLAEIAAAKGDTKSIDAPLQKAVSLSPNSAAVYNSQVAQLLLAATPPNYGDAQRYAEASTKADLNYASGWYTLGIVYADQSKKDQANSALRKAFDLFKAKNDQTGMQVVNKAYMDLNGKDNSLMTGAGRNEKTNQPGSSGM